MLREAFAKGSNAEKRTANSVFLRRMFASLAGNASGLGLMSQRMHASMHQAAHLQRQIQTSLQIPPPVSEGLLHLSLQMDFGAYNGTIQRNANMPDAIRKEVGLGFLVLALKRLLAETLRESVNTCQTLIIVYLKHRRH